MRPSSIGRSVQLGLLAKDMAGAKAESTRATRARRHIIERLGKLHGLPQKIGQILSLTELADDDTSWTLLTEAPPALSVDAVKQCVEERLGRPVEACFAQFEPEGVSASLSQVHRARLHDGREVAFKVQYPGIADAVWQDLRALGWLTAPVGGLRRGFNLAAYREEVRQTVSQELDFRAEADTLRMYGALTHGVEDVAVPEPIAELSNDTILTMTWLDGARFREVLTWPVAERHAVGEALARLFLRGCFQWRVLHGDPHPGNLRFRRGRSGPVLGLLDFGCVKPLPDGVVDSFQWLIERVIDRSIYARAAEILPRYVAAGFDEDLLAPMEHRLLALTELLFEPFREDRAFRMSDWRIRERIDSVLGDDRWNFRFAGPATMLVFIRAYQGLLQYLKALDAPVNWQRLFLEMTRDRRAVATVAPPTGARDGDQGALLSEKLCVTVHRDGRKTVELTFRAVAAKRIDELMPDDVLEALKRRSIDIHAIKRRVVNSQCAPGELFTLDEDNKRVRVWLE